MLPVMFEDTINSWSFLHITDRISVSKWEILALFQNIRRDSSALSAVNVSCWWTKDKTKPAEDLVSRDHIVALKTTGNTKELQ